MNWKILYQKKFWLRKLKNKLYFLDEVAIKNILINYSEQIDEHLKTSKDIKLILAKFNINEISQTAFGSLDIKNRVKIVEKKERGVQLVSQIIALPWMWIIFLPIAIFFFVAGIMMFLSPAILLSAFLSYVAFDVGVATGLLFGIFFVAIIMFFIMYFWMTASWFGFRYLLHWTITIFAPNNRVALKIKNYNFWRWTNKLTKRSWIIMLIIMLVFAAVGIPGSVSTNSTIFGAQINNHFFHEQNNVLIKPGDTINEQRINDFDHINISTQGLWFVNNSKRDITIIRTPAVGELVTVKRAYRTKEGNLLKYKFSVLNVDLGTKTINLQLNSSGEWYDYIFSQNSHYTINIDAAKVSIKN